MTASLPIDALRVSAHLVEGLRDLLEGHRLVPHFQPIAQLSDGCVLAHEALIRTPAGCAWRNPDELFAASRACGLQIDLELECLRAALQGWTQLQAGGQLFVNLSAQALVAALAQRDLQSMLTAWGRSSVMPQGLVVELTEHEHVRDHDAVAAAVDRLRRHKVRIALDDFGDGRSSLRLWAQLKPEFVKIDKYFIHGLHEHPDKVQTLRALMQISATMGSTLVAEGIEVAEELHVLRDLGLQLGQGWFFGRPSPEALEMVPEAALCVIRSKDVAVFPERRRTLQQRASARSLMTESAPVMTELTNSDLFERFSSDEQLRAVAVVDDGGLPVGLIGRQRFVDRYARPYFKELYGRRTCMLFANRSPRLVDVHHGIEELTEVLTSDDQRYLSEGIIITENGRYRGLASGEDLVRSVTESRIEAARHANPLSLLPGNIPLTQHIQRLLAAGREFVACYGDLNHFKPYNDLYGYWRGDEMILLAARAFTAHADSRRDFVGHVGGDDFVVLFQSDDWDDRCLRAIEQFNTGSRALYDEQAQQAGGVMAEDRHGVQRFHPLTTLSIGAVRVAEGDPRRAEDVASDSARAKRQAKSSGAALYLLEGPPV